jgi:hypothetical protein
MLEVDALATARRVMEQPGRGDKPQLGRQHIGVVVLLPPLEYHLFII